MPRMQQGRHLRAFAPQDAVKSQLAVRERSRQTALSLVCTLIDAIAPADEEDVIYALNAKDTARALGLSSAASTKVRTRRVPLASRQRGHARRACCAGFWLVRPEHASV